MHLTFNSNLWCRVIHKSHYFRCQQGSCKEIVLFYCKNKIFRNTTNKIVTKFDQCLKWIVEEYGFETKLQNKNHLSVIMLRTKIYCMTAKRPMKIFSNWNQKANTSVIDILHKLWSCFL